MSASTGQRTELRVFDEGGARVVCPIAERSAGEHVDVVTPYGFSGFVGTGDDPRLSARFADLAEREGWVCAYLVLNPVLSSPTYFADAATSERDVFVFDLALHEDELFARLSENRRRQVRRADEDDGWLVTDRERLTDFFVAHYPDFMARRQAAEVYQLRPESLRALCDSEHALLLGAQRDGALQAVSLFGHTEYAADFLFNVSLPGEEVYSAPLIWAAVRELKARGVPTLNLGAGIREGDGVARFKERFGADRRPLRIVRQVYRPDVYRALCKQAGRDPESTDYFPAYRYR